MENKENLSQWKSCGALRAKGLVVRYPEYVPLPRACLPSELQRLSQHEKPETLGLLQVRAALCTSHLGHNLVKKWLRRERCTIPVLWRLNTSTSVKLSYAGRALCCLSGEEGFRKAKIMFKTEDWQWKDNIQYSFMSADYCSFASSF